MQGMLKYISWTNQKTDQHGMVWCGVVMEATNCHILRAVELCKTRNEYIKRGKKKTVFIILGVCICKKKDLATQTNKDTRGK